MHTSTGSREQENGLIIGQFWSNVSFEFLVVCMADKKAKWNYLFTVCHFISKRILYFADSNCQKYFKWLSFARNNVQLKKTRNNTQVSCHQIIGPHCRVWMTMYRKIHIIFNTRIYICPLIWLCLVQVQIYINKKNYKKRNKFSRLMCPHFTISDTECLILAHFLWLLWSNKAKCMS